ncbi:MAG: choline transporter [Acidimicrobiales bacterium]|nr:MAG: choline transporter [Acidimicrobiales bacterium]
MAQNETRLRTATLFTVAERSVSAFEFRDVWLTTDGKARLQGFTAMVPLGGICVVAGPSGAGKTTLLRLCNRLEVPDSGTIAFKGAPLDSWDPLVLRRRVAMVFQRPVLFEGTVADNLRVAEPELSTDAMCDLLAACGITATRDFLDRVARSLSGGEGQRVCLARALTTRPEVLLADEPTASVDSESVERIERSIRLLASRGLTVVWVTHDPRQQERLADYVIEVRDGRCVRHGPVARAEGGVGEDCPPVGGEVRPDSEAEAR